MIQSVLLKELCNQEKSLLVEVLLILLWAFTLINIAETSVEKNKLQLLNSVRLLTLFQKLCQLMQQKMLLNWFQNWELYTLHLKRKERLMKRRSVWNIADLTWLTESQETIWKQVFWSQCYQRSTRLDLLLKQQLQFLESMIWSNLPQNRLKVPLTEWLYWIVYLFFNYLYVSYIIRIYCWWNVL